jgi:hypothetical protein
MLAVSNALSKTMLQLAFSYPKIILHTFIMVYTYQNIFYTSVEGPHCYSAFLATLLEDHMIC